MKTYYFNGLLRWCKVYPARTLPDGRVLESQLDTKFDQNGNWSIDFSPDDEDVFLSTGLKLKPKEFEGRNYYNLRRPNDKQIKTELVHFGPPIVLLSKDDELVPTEKSIGNGSYGTVKFITYPAGPYMGHRLEKILVTDLVEYDGLSDDSMPF